MIAFIDDHRRTYGVEPICKVLPIASADGVICINMVISPWDATVGLIMARLQHFF